MTGEKKGLKKKIIRVKASSILTYNKEITRDLFFSRGFQLGKLTVYEGDYVFVRNADSFDPDSPEGCDIARVVRCYDSGKQDVGEFRNSS